MSNVRSAEMIRIVIIDDHALFREGAAILLDQESDFTIAAKYASTKEALINLDVDLPTVILLDFDLGPEPTLEFTREAKTRGYKGNVLVVTAGVNEHEAVQLIQGGVSGIFHKHNPPQNLCGVIRQVAAGEVCLEKDYLKPLFRNTDRTRSLIEPQLTERDKSILRYLFQGLGNKDIGWRLQLSEGAVKSCLRQLFQKVGVHTRAQLVKVALEQYRDEL